MSEIRFSAANVHALPLLLDIIDSTAFLYADDRPRWRLLEEIEAASATELSLGKGEFLVGFVDHFPFGFAGLYENEECGEIFGPFVYRDYLRKGLGTTLLREVLQLARSKEINLVYGLVPAAADWAATFYNHNGFEPISSETEAIKRWCDGLLAERQIAPGTQLVAALLETENALSH